MRLDRTATIAGLEIKEIRDALREIDRRDSWTVSDLAKQMSISPTHAEWLTEALVEQRILERKSALSWDKDNVESHGTHLIAQQTLGAMSHRGGRSQSRIHLPLARVASSMRQLFGLYISRSTTNQFKAVTTQMYAGTYDNLLKRLCCGRLLHVDETSANVMGKNGYVWVLTSMEEVAYFYSPTREGGTIQAMLNNFSGVLVSDFYAAYDSVDCPQQKCLIHLIRDLNEELLKHPFDQVLKRLVANFAGFVRPMIETVDRHGLKKHFLGKHRISVARFYKHLAGSFDNSEVSRKIIERLQKNRNKLFTFLEFDGIP